MDVKVTNALGPSRFERRESEKSDNVGVAQRLHAALRASETSKLERIE